MLVELWNVADKIWNLLKTWIINYLKNKSVTFLITVILHSKDQKLTH